MALASPLEWRHQSLVHTSDVILLDHTKPDQNLMSEDEMNGGDKKLKSTQDTLDSASYVLEFDNKIDTTLILSFSY